MPIEHMTWNTVAARFAAALLAFDTVLLDPPGDVHSPHHTPLPICYFHCAVAAAPTDPLLLLLFDVCVLCAAAAAAAGVCVASAVATQRYYHAYCYRR